MSATTTSATNLLPAQQQYLEFLKAGRTKVMTDEAKNSDKSSHAFLNKLRAHADNAECFDCTATKPGWAVLPHGVFVCIDCAQTHRHLGRHISQTKAVNTGTYLWFPPELRVMNAVGNTVAAEAFAACNLPIKPQRDATPEKRLEYARAKYAGSAVPQWQAAARGGKQGVTPRPVVASGVKEAVCKAAPIPIKALQELGPPPTAPPPPRPTSPVNLIDFDAVCEARTPATLPHQTTIPSSSDAFFAQFGL